MWPSQTGIDHLDLMFSTQKREKKKQKSSTHTSSWRRCDLSWTSLSVTAGNAQCQHVVMEKHNRVPVLLWQKQEKKNQEVIFLMSALFLLHKGCNSSLECFLLLFIECWDWKHLWWRSGYTSGPCFIYKTCINGKIKSGLFMYFPV